MNNLDLFSASEPTSDEATARPPVTLHGASTGTLTERRRGTPPMAHTLPAAGRTVQLAPGAVLLDPDLQLRIVHSPGAVAALAESLYACGQLAPVLVRPAENAGQFRLVAGHTRASAHALLASAGRTADRDLNSRCSPLLTAVVYELSDGDALRAAVAENAARTDLCALDRAHEVGRARAVLLARDGAEPSIDALSGFLNRAYGLTAEQLRVATHLPMALVVSALSAPVAGEHAGSADPARTESGVMPSTPSDLAAALNRLTHRVLYRAATAMKDGDPATATELLGRAAGGSTPGITAALPGRPRTITTPAADRPYTVRLAKPLNTYAPDEARAHAEQLLAACAILARQASPDVASVFRGTHGRSLLVQIPAETASIAERDQALAVIEALADEVRGWRSGAAEPGQ